MSFRTPVSTCHRAVHSHRPRHRLSQHVQSASQSVLCQRPHRHPVSTLVESGIATWHLQACHVASHFFGGWLSCLLKNGKRIGTRDLCRNSRGVGRCAKHSHQILQRSRYYLCFKIGYFVLKMARAGVEPRTTRGVKGLPTARPRMVCLKYMELDLFCGAIKAETLTNG